MDATLTTGPMPCAFSATPRTTPWQLPWPSPSSKWSSATATSFPNRVASTPNSLTSISFDFHKKSRQLLQIIATILIIMRSNKTKTGSSRLRSSVRIPATLPSITWPRRSSRARAHWSASLARAAALSRRTSRATRWCRTKFQHLYFATYGRCSQIWKFKTLLSRHLDNIYYLEMWILWLCHPARFTTIEFLMAQLDSCQKGYTNCPKQEWAPFPSWLFLCGVADAKRLLTPEWADTSRDWWFVRFGWKLTRSKYCACRAFCAGSAFVRFYLFRFWFKVVDYVTQIVIQRLIHTMYILSKIQKLCSME